MAKKKYPKAIKTRAQKAKYTRALNAELKKGRKASYAKRVATGIAKGKTKQQARGHKVREHIERKEKERIKLGGLTASEIKTIIRWHSNVFNPNLYREVPTEEELIEWSQEKGYSRFQQYRKTWDAARRQYKNEIADGTWESRGLKYLHHLTGMAKAPDEQWLYYH